MTIYKQTCLLVLLFALTCTNAWADKYSDALKTFKEANGTTEFFENNYGYALFPTIAKVGMVIGGAGGDGRVYEKEAYVGDTSMTQFSVGLQLGAQGTSQIIFFEDKPSFNNFTSGNFEFSVEASAVVITAGATAAGGTKGSTASASGNKNNATTDGRYVKGMATFVIVKGGLMYEAVVAGQKFKYSPLN